MIKILIILEPKGSRSVASSINGRLSASIIRIFYYYMKSMQLLNFVDSLFCFVLCYVEIILIVSTSVTDQNE
jgi:hypothetical protein